jgi:hypothetical protein
MSVFLRWGVFGILGVAALLYAYNASKRLAGSHATRAPAPISAPVPHAQMSESPQAQASESPQNAAPAAAPETPQAVSAQCEAELAVAQRAVDMRKRGEPLDRVLRIQEIAWQESPERRARLEKVATRWFDYEGDFSPETLRIAVLNDCRASPAP